VGLTSACSRFRVGGRNEGIYHQVRFDYRDLEAGRLGIAEERGGDVSSDTKLAMIIGAVDRINRRFVSHTTHLRTPESMNLLRAALVDLLSLAPFAEDVLGDEKIWKDYKE